MATTSYLGKVVISFKKKATTNYRFGYSTTNNMATVANWQESPVFEFLQDGIYYFFAVDKHTGSVYSQKVTSSCNSNTPGPTQMPVLDMVVISEALVNDPLRADFTEQQLS